MRKLMASKIWIPAFVLAALILGCGDPDKNANGANPGAPTTPPTVLSVIPLNASNGVCPNNGVIISATFSKAMNPATIEVATVTLRQCRPPRVDCDESYDAWCARVRSVRSCPTYWSWMN